MSRQKIREWGENGPDREERKKCVTRHWDPVMGHRVGCSTLPVMGTSPSGAPGILSAPAFCSQPNSPPILLINWGLTRWPRLPNLYLLPWFLLCFLAGAFNYSLDCPIFISLEHHKVSMFKTETIFLPSSCIHLAVGVRNLTHSQLEKAE